MQLSSILAKALDALDANFISISLCEDTGKTYSTNATLCSGYADPTAFFYYPQHQIFCMTGK